MLKGRVKKGSSGVLRSIWWNFLKIKKGINVGPGT